MPTNVQNLSLVTRVMVKNKVGHLTLSGKDVIRIITDTLVELWGGGNPHVMAIELQRSTPSESSVSLL